MDDILQQWAPNQSGQVEVLPGKLAQWLYIKNTS